MKNLKLPKTKEKLEEIELLDEKKVNKLNTLLDFYKDSYNEENNRKKAIDTKSLYMLLIAIILVFLLLIKINIMDLNRGWNEISGGIIAVRIIFLSLSFAEIVLSTISILKFIKVLSLKKYLKLDSKDFVVDNFKNAEFEEVLIQTLNVYKISVNKNSVLNDKAIKKLNTATVLTVISLFLLIVIYIFAFFVK